MNKKKSIKFFFLILGLLALFFFIRSIQFKQLQTSFSSLSLGVILLVILLTLANVVSKAIRWQMLVKGITDTKISFTHAYDGIIMGVAAGSIIPGRVDIARPLLTKEKYGLRLSHMFSGIAIERVLDLLVLILAALLGMIFLATQTFLSIYVSITLLVLVIGGTALIIYKQTWCVYIIKKMLQITPLSLQRKESLLESATNLLKGFDLLKQPSKALSLLLVSALALGLEFVRVGVVLYFFNIPFTSATLIFSFSAAVLLSLLTTIPGGIGVTEYSLATILQFFSQANENGVKSAIIIDRIFSYYLLILIGSIRLVLRKEPSKDLKEKKD